MLSVVVLAAGSGTRMKSRTHKVLHQLAGVPMATHVLRAARQLEPQKIAVVVGHQAEEVSDVLAAPDVQFVLQEEQLGTGHAFLVTAPLLEDQGGEVLVMSGDGALLTGDTLLRMREVQAGGPGMTLLTARVPDPTGLGRVIKGADGLVERIVEHKDATPEERQVNEIVVGTYLFDRNGYRLARELGSDNAAGELYITDLIGLYRQAGLPVRTAETPLEEYAGPNDRQQLAAAERVIRDRIRTRWLLAGVTMHAPETVFIDEDVELAPDVTLEPFVILRGRTRVGRDSVVGAHTLLADVTVPEGSVVPPFSHLK